MGHYFTIITMQESNVALFLEIVKKKHIGAFTLLTKTTKHIFDTNLTIVQRKSRFWGGKKYTNSHISNHRRDGGKECGSGKGEGCRSGSGSGKKKGKESCLWEL